MAVNCTARALDICPDNAFCLTIDGFAHNNLLHQLDIASKRYDQALEQNPNEALSWLLKGAMHAFQDDDVRAIFAVDKARHLSPLDPFDYFYDSLSATAHLSGGNYCKALEFAERSQARNNRHQSALRAKISALYHLGRKEDACIAGLELLRQEPDLTVDRYLHQHPAAEFNIGRQMASALRAAGIP